MSAVEVFDDITCEPIPEGRLMTFVNEKQIYNIDIKTLYREFIRTGELKNPFTTLPLSYDEDLRVRLYGETQKLLVRLRVTQNKKHYFGKMMRLDTFTHYGELILIIFSEARKIENVSIKGILSIPHWSLKICGLPAFSKDLTSCIENSKEKILDCTLTQDPISEDDKKRMVEYLKKEKHGMEALIARLESDGDEESSSDDEIDDEFAGFMSFLFSTPEFQSQLQSQVSPVRVPVLVRRMPTREERRALSTGIQPNMNPNPGTALPTFGTGNSISVTNSTSSSSVTISTTSNIPSVIRRRRVEQEQPAVPIRRRRVEEQPEVPIRRREQPEASRRQRMEHEVPQIEPVDPHTQLLQAISYNSPMEVAHILHGFPGLINESNFDVTLEFIISQEISDERKQMFLSLINPALAE